MSDQQHAVVMGDPESGFVVVGPFNSKASACHYIGTDKSGETMWAVELHKPAQERERTHGRS
jgi:hypothetical protein